MYVKTQVIITGTLIFLIILVAIFAPALSPYEYDQTNFANALRAPDSVHLMGTDQEGRDLLSRVIHGSRISIAVAVGTAAMALVIGTVLGAVSGYAGGKTDELIMRTVDVFYAVPDLLLIVLLTLVIGTGVTGIVISLGVMSWMRVARIVRGSVLQIKSFEYVESARALGASPRIILARHILPNTLSPLIVTVTFSVPYAILTESTLSFLGLGISPPEASWGTLASTGWQGIRTFPHLIVFPSIAIFITALSFNLFGEGIRDLLATENSR
ncbi:MAG: ABC transporter permease [Candidatus Dadabacteria bacterium]|nr:ABC transporter permease [Candidatus Dadabacteria bacterium]MDE0477775.1 ABC transporter permease [Candidatus Dadabacteria bacterium]